MSILRAFRVTHRVCWASGCTRRGRHAFPSLTTCPACTAPMVAVRGWGR